MHFSDDLIVAFKVRCSECNWVGWSADCIKEQGGRHEVLVCLQCQAPVLAVWKDGAQEDAKDRAQPI